MLSLRHISPAWRSRCLSAGGPGAPSWVCCGRGSRTQRRRWARATSTPTGASWRSRQVPPGSHLAQLFAERVGCQQTEPLGLVDDHVGAVLQAEVLLLVIRLISLLTADRVEGVRACSFSLSWSVDVSCPMQLRVKPDVCCARVGVEADPDQRHDQHQPAAGRRSRTGPYPANGKAI